MVDVYVLLGQYDQAIATLEQLLVMEYSRPLTAAELSLNPMYDPLRSFPRFQALLETREN